MKGERQGEELNERVTDVAPWLVVGRWERTFIMIALSCPYAVFMPLECEVFARVFGDRNMVDNSPFADDA
jgi:hypothetical protein